MDEDRLIALSPRHSVLLAKEYSTLIDKPPSRDFVVRTLASRQANGMPLMTAELVIASYETRREHPAAQNYPMHFRKTYFPGRLHGDPKDEFDNQSKASEILGLPPPIGFTSSVFRSCLIPGKPYNRLSPFGVEPEDANIALAQKLPLASAVGLWRLLEDGFSQLTRLHAAGMAHGDAELHNFIVCPSPLEMMLIDFESAIYKRDLDDDAWAKRQALDLAPVLREAVFLQCALGRQTGALAEAAEARMDALFRSAKRFRREIARQAESNG